MFMKQEPKYDCNAVAQIINRATGIPIPDDEPLIFFRAKDTLARDFALAPYIAECRRLGLVNQAEVVQLRYDAFNEFAANHPDRMRTPDSAPIDSYRAPEPLAMEVIERGSRYRLTGGAIVQFVKHQKINDHLVAVIPGTTTEELLAVLIDRIGAQDMVLPSPENTDILHNLVAARQRQLDRMARVNGVVASVQGAADGIAKDIPGAVEQFGIVMIPCESSNLEAFGYRATDQTYALRFRGSRIYHYKDVPADVHVGMLAATSKGGYAAQHITGKYEGVAQVPAAATA